MAKCFVLDFDGTLTDVWSRADVFYAHYKGLLLERCEHFGITQGDLTSQWRVEEATIRANPGRFGWKIDGVIAAPATVDPFVVAGCVSNRCLDAFGLFTDVQERQDLMLPMFAESYRAAEPELRTETHSVLSKLVERAVVTVVTNSETAAVRERLDSLDAALSAKIEVVGGARKFVVGDVTGVDLTAVPKTFSMPGLERECYLHRGIYAQTLEGICRKNDVGMGDVTVAGDIFEMDLALPFHLGATVHLVEHAGTQKHERAFAQSQPRATAGELSDLLG